MIQAQCFEFAPLCKLQMNDTSASMLGNSSGNWNKQQHPHFLKQKFLGVEFNPHPRSSYWDMVGDRIRHGMDSTMPHNPSLHLAHENNTILVSKFNIIHMHHILFLMKRKAIFVISSLLQISSVASYISFTHWMFNTAQRFIR